MAKKHSTEEVPSKRILALEQALQKAQDGFVDLMSMAAATAALMSKSEYSESDEDLARSSNMLHQLCEKAAFLADITDSVNVLKGVAA